MSSTTQPPAPTRTSDRKLQIALAGNPNTGKSTLFNRLTGIRQRVGNYPGVTVEKKTGSMRLGDTLVSVIDLPGTYSLVAESADEHVVIDVLSGRVGGVERPDVVVCVVDASNLKRNLFLAAQIADTATPMVIALNMIDAAETDGLQIDHERLGTQLGIEVVPMIASKGKGVDELRAAIERSLQNRSILKPVSWPPVIERATEKLGCEAEERLGTRPTCAECRRMLFDLNATKPSSDGTGVDQAWAKVIAEARREIEEDGHSVTQVEAIACHEHLEQLLEGVITHTPPAKPSQTNRLDWWLTHRVFGLLFFVAVMYVVFLSIYTWAAPLMKVIGASTGWMQGVVGEWFASTPMLQSLIVDGLIAGIGGVLIFLPQILILFFFISLLEDTGYMPRAAFLMDKLFGWCGLNGKSFVPMLSSFACAIPGVMGARTIAEPRARLTTILIAPLMSCSARLPVYVLLIAAFIEPVYGPWWASLTLLVMHFVGLAVALPVAFILNRFILKTQRQPFILEMPAYRMPKLRDVTWRMWERGREFVMRAGTVILAMTIIIWALLYFPHGADVAENVVAEQMQVDATAARALLASDEPLAKELEQAIDGAYIEQSLLGRFGKTVQPIFDPAGYDWKITVAVLGSFPAREVFIATFGTIYSLGGDIDEESDELKATMQGSTWTQGHRVGLPVFTPVVAISIMVFFALCSQCGSTLAIIARETNWRWALFSFTYMTVLAWIGAVAVYQLGSMITA
jgi:ferrous iron transport protein B